jgi:hypothetical protein
MKVTGAEFGNTLNLKSVLDALVPPNLKDVYRHHWQERSGGHYRSGMKCSSDVKADIQKKYLHNSDLLD